MTRPAPSSPYRRSTDRYHAGSASFVRPKSDCEGVLVLALSICATVVAIWDLLLLLALAAHV